MQIKAAVIGVLALFGAGSCGAWAQTPGNAASNDAITWNDAPSGAKHKSLSFVRAVLQIPQGQPIGKIYHDIMCALEGYPITIRRSGDMRAADFQGAFAEQQQAAGYTTDQDSLFGDIGNKDPDLLVAAAITGLNIKVCAGMETQGGVLLRGAGSNATAEIVVNWQVANGLERKVIFKATTQGKATVKTDYKSGDMVAMRAAFSQAAKALFAMPEFQQATTFTADEQATAAQLSEPPPPPTYIASVPLSAQPFQEQLKGTRAQVVTIFTGMASGSGFYIADGLIMTNHHVASKGTAVKVRFLSGKEIAGLSIASNAKRDVALIRTENVNAAGLPLHVQTPEVGSQTYAIGSPEGQDFEGTVSAGIVSAVREFAHQQFIQSDVAVTHGSSGGPLLDGNGNVIGITDLNGDKNDKQVGLNMFIPIGEALNSVGVVVQPPEPAKLASTKKKSAP